MPAVQSKVNYDGKPSAEDENLKLKSGAKLKNKDRSNLRKNETTCERNLRQKKKIIVPELDLKSNNSSPKHKKNQIQSPTKKKNQPWVPTNAARLSKKTQFEIGEELSKSKKFHKEIAKSTKLHNEEEPLKRNRGEITVDDTKRNNSVFSIMPMDETKRHNSVFCLTPIMGPDIEMDYSCLSNSPMNYFENMNPNHPSENFFECSGPDEFFYTSFPCADFENLSEYSYATPTLAADFPPLSMTSVTSCNKKESPGILRHFKELLHQEETSKTNLLSQEEIALLKDIVKADERHRRLQRDDYQLLKEILSGQLKEIFQQERVIKIALKKIRGPREDEVEVTTLKVDSAEQPMEDAGKTVSKRKMAKKSHSHRMRGRTPREEYEQMMKGVTSARSSDKPLNQTQRQEVDIIFKNVPSLEKEIRILRSLGIKLEETLNKSAEQPVHRTIILHEIQTRYMSHSKHYPSSSFHPKGIMMQTGQAQEFQIRHQTIDELKLEREFFIPIDFDNFTLQRTDFHKLSRNPQLLLRRLKPFDKGTTMKFNFIEQDPVFFNHFLAKMCNIYTETSECHATYIPHSVEFPKTNYRQDLLCLKNGSGDFHPDVEVKQKMIENGESTASNLKKTSKCSFGKRKKRKHCTTPMPNGKVTSSKNRLVRNVFFGTLQLAMLSILAVAIWFPDLSCL